MSVTSFAAGMCIGVFVGVALCINNIKKIETDFKAAQKEINAFVWETGDGQWKSSIAGKTITLDGKEVNRRKDLLKLIEAGIEDGSWRGHLRTKGSPVVDVAVPR